MTIWVVGKTGLLAKAFIAYLEKKGQPFIATSKEEVDVTDKVQVEAFLDKHATECVINCSAYTAVDRAEKEKEQAYRLNYEAPAHLAYQMKKRGGRFVHFSTDFVFDGKAREGGFSEEDKEQGTSVYGQSKLAGDKAIKEVGGNYLILRISWLYGRGGNHFVQKILTKLKGEAPLTVVADHWGSLTLTDEVVEATFKLEKETGLFHFSGRGVTSWCGVAQFVAAHSSAEPSKRIVPITYASLNMATPRPSFSYLNCEKYERVTAEKIRPWQEGLKAYLESYAEKITI